MRSAHLFAHVAAAATLLIATPALADRYRMIDRDKPTKVMLVECKLKPDGPTLAWIKRNCTTIDPKEAQTGPIIDVLYSAAGNSADRY